MTQRWHPGMIAWVRIRVLSQRDEGTIEAETIDERGRPYQQGAYFVLPDQAPITPSVLAERVMGIHRSNEK